MAETNLDVFVEALPPRLQIDYGVRAEERGFRAAWFPEITFGDAFGPATAVATKTSQIELGTGVVGIWSRSPVTMTRLAGELADGIIGYCYSAAYVRDTVLPNLRAGAERAGRSLDGFDVACGFPTIVTPDDAGLEQIKGQVMMFATAKSSSPEYASS